MTQASLIRSFCTPVAALGLLLGAFATTGCGGGGTTTPDMSSATNYAAIQTDMTNRGCLLGACHGKPGGTPAMNNMILDTTPGQEMANYTLLLNATPVVTPTGHYVDKAAPATSLILTQPMSATHTGGQVFMNTQDPSYVTWLAWIQAGAPF